MERDGRILKKKTIACNVGDVLEFLSPWGKDITIGVESTYNWYWLIDALKVNGIPSCLGHALYIKRKMSSKHKNDPVDARGLADLLRTNQFPVSYEYPREMRTVRDLLRRRHLFTRRRAGAFTHFQTSLHQDGCIEPISTKLRSKVTRKSLVDLTSNTDLQEILSSDLQYVEALDQLIDDLGKKILRKAQHHNRKHFDLLQTIAGCGNTTALTVLYETHTIGRFRSAQCYSSYSRVVRADNSSAGKLLGGTTNDKIGNPYLKWAFSEIGICMIRHYPRVKQWHDKQARQHGQAGAHARLRHKIAVVVYHMLKNDKVFDMDRFLGVSKKESERKKEKVSKSQSAKNRITKKASDTTKIRRRSVADKSANRKLRGRSALCTTGKRKVAT
jgi:transposase